MTTQLAAIYLRVSTEKQTVENQRPDLGRLAAARGLEIVEEYVDVESAAKPRDAYERLMLDAPRPPPDQGGGGSPKAAPEARPRPLAGASERNRPATTRDTTTRPDAGARHDTHPQEDTMTTIDTAPLGIGKPGTSAESAACQRILERVCAELPKHDAKVLGRLASVVIVAEEVQADEIRLSLSASHAEALALAAHLDTSGAGVAVPYLASALAARKPHELIVLVVLADGSMFCHALEVFDAPPHTGRA